MPLLSKYCRPAAYTSDWKLALLYLCRIAIEKHFLLIKSMNSIGVKASTTVIVSALPYYRMNIIIVGIFLLLNLQLSLMALIVIVICKYYK